MAIIIGGFIQKRLSAAAEWAMGTSHLTSPAEFQAAGVGPLPADMSATSLYLDLVKRTVTNLIYEDRPTIFYDHNLDPVVADRYRLERRILGEDTPLEAHTMVGVQRLNNLQACVEKLLAERIPGDLLEAGVFRGGASIFLRALLKVNHCTDRQVFACDTFRVLQARKPSPVLDFILSSALTFISWIPSPALHRAVVIGLHRRIKPELRNLPLLEDPSPALIKLVLFQLRYYARGPVINTTKDQTGVEAVRSHFAAYGLLDDQVKFLEGFSAIRCRRPPSISWPCSGSTAIFTKAQWTSSTPSIPS
jgi:Macrocin-O-methyltransferase (TylF)